MKNEERVLLKIAIHAWSGDESGLLPDNPFSIIKFTRKQHRQIRVVGEFRCLQRQSHIKERRRTAARIDLSTSFA